MNTAFSGNVNKVKIALTLLLFLCLLDLPYGYYELVRIGGAIGFTFLAFDSRENGNSTLFFVYLSLAILFQPLIKIALGRELWKIVDVLVAVFLILTITKHPKDN